MSSGLVLESFCQAYRDLLYVGLYSSKSYDLNSLIGGACKGDLFLEG